MVDSLLPGPEHLNNAGCIIKASAGRGRGVYASRPLPRKISVEISPVLLFSKTEYEEHGKHTVLDHYTFVWPDGRMALALGLGSLFNHSDSPNVSFTLDTSTDSIRYMTTRDIDAGEELCIFYGHKLWFSPIEKNLSHSPIRTSDSEQDDGWGGLSMVNFSEQPLASNPIAPLVNPFAYGDEEETISEQHLPFTRYKLPPEEETLDSIRTIQAWVVDVPDQRQIANLLKWLKKDNLDAANLSHLKRVRKQNTTTTFLLAICSEIDFPTEPPKLPPELNLPEPYVIFVPASSALTPTSLNLKSTLWPTIFTPRRKDEEEKWTRGKAAWAWQSMQKVVQAAVEAWRAGELPIAAYVPPPYEAFHSPSTQPEGFIARDMRTSTSHPLRHAVINVIRKIADHHASFSSYLAEPLPGQTPLAQPNEPSPATKYQDDTDESMLQNRNGSNYLLTSLTLFTTHEPCIMCSMALLHSRVKEIVYLIPMPRTGGCGSIACLPTLKGVNHRYGILRWKLEFKSEEDALYELLRVAHDRDVDKVWGVDDSIDA